MAYLRFLWKEKIEVSNIKAALTLSTKPTRLYAKWLNSTSCSLRGQYVNLEGNQPYHTKSTRTQHAYVRRKPVDNTKSMRSVHDVLSSRYYGLSSRSLPGQSCWKFDEEVNTK